MIKYILISIFLIIVGVLIYILSIHHNSTITGKAINLSGNKTNKNKKLPSCPTHNSILVNSWKYYKKVFISNDGRVIDHLRGSVSTSEGQAYAMRRALLMRDKETFDKVYNWAKYNLQHKNDHLFAWLWGPKQYSSGEAVEYGIIDQNGAPDAGVEIAMCLILASKVWNQENYLEDAHKIINDIWKKETIVIKGERILVSGFEQRKEQNIEVNPSYFMVYSFRVFSEVDTEHDWQKVVDSSYRLVNYCIDHIPSGLPPDVFYINKFTGKITFDLEKSDFSYDAIRIFYRFYVDYQLTNDSRNTKLLSRAKIFIHEWKKEEKFYTNYKQNGEPKDYNEPVGSIALLLPVIKMYDKKIAREIYIKIIKEQYNRKGYCGDPMDYYAQNLVWFGNWLYLNEKNIMLFKY